MLVFTRLATEAKERHEEEETTMQHKEESKKKKEEDELKWETTIKREGIKIWKNRKERWNQTTPSHTTCVCVCVCTQEEIQHYRATDRWIGDGAYRRNALWILVTNTPPIQNYESESDWFIMWHVEGRGGGEWKTERETHARSGLLQDIIPARPP